MNLNSVRGALLAGAAMAVPAAVHAAEPQTANGISEVVVTADKRSERAVLDTPGAVQAISGAALQKSGAEAIIDIAPKIAGLQLEDLGPGDKKYIIRGINSTGASTTGVYYDEAVISGANANDGGGRQADVRLFDLDHIEVLRGPQGTLYGASSESGVIRFVTRKPSLSQVGGYIDGEVSDTQGGGLNKDVNGALNLPIIKDVLAVRVVGWSIDDSGFIDQTRVPAGPLKNVNNDRTDGYRLMLRYAPTDRLNVLVSTTNQITDSNGSSRYTPAGVTSFGTTGFPGVPGGDLVNTDLTRSPWHDALNISDITAEYRLDNGLITATASRFDRKIDFSFDSSPILFSFKVPVPAVTLEPQSRDVTTGELRYASRWSSPVNLVVGVFAQREVSDLTVQVMRTNALGLPAGPFSPSNADDGLLNPTTGNTFFGRTDHRVSTSWAGFSEVTWDATDRLSFVGGARYYSEHLTGLQETTHPFGGFGAAPVGPQSNDDTFSSTTFKASAAYRVSSELRLYALASEGFRGGGLNAANLPFASGIPQGFAPDSLWNYEVGAKGELLNGGLLYQAAAYLIDWKNIQVSEVDATGAFPFTSNAGRARVEGVEFELEAHPTHELSLSLSGSSQDAVLTEDQPPIPGNPNVGQRGDQLPNVPRLQGSFTAEYNHPLTDDLNATLALDLTYRGRTHTQLNSASPFNVALAAYSLATVRASVSTGDWTVTAFARNLFNTRAQIDAISSTQDPLARITVRPRAIGVNLLKSF